MENLLKKWSKEKIEKEKDFQKRNKKSLWEKRVQLLEEEIKKRD